MGPYKRSFEFGIVRFFRNIVFFLKEFTLLSSTQAGAFIDKTVNLAEATILKSVPKHVGVCDCPSKDEPGQGGHEAVCTLIREVYQGERIVEPVFIRNLEKDAIEVELQALPFTSLTGQTVDTPVLSPDKVTLQPDEKVLVSISYETADFQSGQRYTSEILVKGFCDQKITLVVHVFSENAARCTILQKKYIRPHNWRDHFYPHEDTKEEDKSK